jgi:thymidylate kinase
MVDELNIPLASTNKKSVFFITGASGVGKTTLVQRLRRCLTDTTKIAIFGFDSIGVPSLEEMKQVYGSPQQWQKEATKRWVAKILYEVPEPVVVLEGQVNIDFIYGAFADHNFSAFNVILIDCSEAEMIRRLRSDRGQPDLANESMKTWSAYLRKQAEERRLPVIETSRLSIGDGVKELREILTNALK